MVEFFIEKRRTVETGESPTKKKKKKKKRDREVTVSEVAAGDSTEAEVVLPEAKIKKKQKKKSKESIGEVEVATEVTKSSKKSKKRKKTNPVTETVNTTAEGGDTSSPTKTAPELSVVKAKKKKKKKKKDVAAVEEQSPESTKDVDELVEDKSPSKKRKRSLSTDAAKPSSEEAALEGEAKKEEQAEEETGEEEEPMFVAFVGQIPFDSTTVELENHLKECGIEHVTVKLGSTRKARGTAFVACTTAESLEQTLALHQTIFKGRKMVVERAKAQKPKKASPAEDQFSTLRVFLGQLPYNATKEDVENHFENHGVGKVTVRILTKKKTGESRGIAFADCTDEKQVVRALRVHHTRLLGRVINVERTVGGGGKGEKRKTKLKELRKRQGAKVLKEVKETLNQVIQEAPSTEVSIQDVDERAIEALGTLPRDIVKALFKEYVSIDFTAVKNRPAYLMGTIKRYREKLKDGGAFVAEESTLEAMEGPKRKAKRNQRHGNSKGGPRRNSGGQRNNSGGNRNRSGDSGFGRKRFKSK